MRASNGALLAEGRTRRRRERTTELADEGIGPPATSPRKLTRSPRRALYAGGPARRTVGPRKAPTQEPAPLADLVVVKGGAKPDIAILNRASACRGPATRRATPCPTSTPRSAHTA